MGHNILIFLIIIRGRRIGYVPGNKDGLRFIFEHLDIIQRFPQMIGWTGTARGDMQVTDYEKGKQ